MKSLAIAAFALLAGLAIGPAANAATYTSHYDHVGRGSQSDAQLQADTVTGDGIAGFQRLKPSAAYRSCMRQRGWQYRYVTLDKETADPNFRSNARLQPG